MTLQHELTIPAVEAAPLLLGAIITRQLAGNTVTARIVEVEAYDQLDPASHSFKGETKRTLAMFGPAGHMYVYFTYGMHYCCNVVVGAEGQGSAVLIRAVEPLSGLGFLRERRPGIVGDIQLTNGPGKLCQALSITLAENGHDLSMPPLKIELQQLQKNETIIQTTRIGISKAKDKKSRFYIKANPYVSLPR
ncbi:MAG: DNA-3-methyladenine glycosylase [Patescibacteria group bacterium]|nr:DNA-3-methyladenine glycosylase [Patescibacteria group bacterium]